MTAHRDPALPRHGRLPVFSTVAHILVLSAAVLCAAVVAAPPASAPASSSPPAASAIDAGIAGVTSVRGVLVLDPPFALQGRHWHQARTLFAATSAGDRKADVRYAADWAAAGKDYRSALHALSVEKVHWTTRSWRRAVNELRREHAVPTRTLWVEDATTHTATLVFSTADALSRRPLRARYIKLGFSAGFPPTFDRTGSWRVWELATQLRAAMDDQSGIRVTDSAVAGRTAWQVVVPAVQHAPSWTALVDKATGLTLAVRSTARGADGERGVSWPYHVRDLHVNEPLPPDTFMVQPDYRVLAHPAGAPSVESSDFTTGSVKEEWFPARDLTAVASASYLAPGGLPAGFALSDVRRVRSKSTADWVQLVYRRGLSTITSWSGPRASQASIGDTEAARSARIPAFERGAWPPLGGFLNSPDEIDDVNAGALDGAPAALSGAIGSPTTLEAWTARDQADLAGDATRAELIAAAGSLEPLEAGAWHRPLDGLLSWIAIGAAAAVAMATAWVWRGERRDASPSPAPGLSLLAWPLAGLAAIVAGACFEWHALLLDGPSWGVRGWDEPLGRWVIAAALAALITSAWMLLARSVRRRTACGTAALFFSLAALAGSAFALVYLPAVARFSVDHSWSHPGEVGESWLLRIVHSRLSPSATLGLYVSIAGALLLFVAVIVLRRRTAESVAPRAALSARDAPAPTPAAPAS